MRKIFIASIIITAMSLQAYCLKFELGCFSTEKTGYGTLSLKNDQSWGDLAVGISINANLSGRDFGLESAVLRYFEYDNGTFGLRYAPLEGISFGYGLLLNDYNSAFYQPAFITNAQNGLRAYYDLSDFEIEGMGTYTHLYGMQVKDISFFGPNIGFEFISDVDSISREGYGRSAVGAFVELPFTDELSIFGEVAGNSGGGQAALAGISFDHDLIIAYSRVRVAAASFNNKFVPCYFTTGYDIDPIDFTSLESTSARKYGTITSFDTGLLGFIAFNFTNENYTGGGSANSGSILITPLDRLSITGFVKELSFLDYRLIKGKDANMVGGSIEYKVNSYMNVSVIYKKTPYRADLKPYDTAYCKLGFEF